MSRRTKRRTGFGAFALLTLGLVAPSAAAKPVLIGSPLEGDFRPGLIRAAGTFSNTTFAEPRAIRSSPVDGAIIRFTVLGVAGAHFRLRVLRPVGGGAFRAVGASNTITIEAQEPNPYLRPVAIEKGDTIAVDLPPEGKIAALRAPESAYAAWVPRMPSETELAPVDTIPGIELGFNAEVLPRPTVSTVAPLSLPFDRGGRVRIHGRDFRQVRAVFFGRFHVQYKVVSERLIVAFPEAKRHPRKMPVSVRTVAGKSEAGPGSVFEFGPGRR